MLDPFEANDILVDIGHIIGPSVGALFAAHSSDGLNMSSMLDVDPDSEMVNSAIGGLFQRIEKQKMRELIQKLSKVTEVSSSGNGKTPRLNTVMALHFRGRLGAMYKWLWFALKVQYADFFESAGSAIAHAGELAKAAMSQSQSTQDDTGSLTDSSSNA